ncbi:MAG: protein-lysine N-methyltransferase [Labilithrix sp.]|nr:protein-lysine N-methyltransferase [Labilithrix sp.]
MPKKTANKKSPKPSIFKARRSKVHGTGVFATAPIKKGKRICEYVGEVITNAEADRRYEQKTSDPDHTFLFTIDSRHVIDAAVGGNDSRFINHSCDPNCEVVLEDKRPMVEAIRDIAVGEELNYDYNLTRDPDDKTREAEKIFACRCGAATCRGTMLAPLKKKKTAAAKKKSAPAKKKTASLARGTKTKTKTKAPAKKKSSRAKTR